MADFQTVAQQFVEFYYKSFDENRQELLSLYRDHSMLTFEAAQTQGAAAIIEKLKSLPFEKIRHQISTLDAQPSSADGNGILVLVTGALLVDEEQRPMNFSQAFNLQKDGQTFFVFNDIFRLNFG